MNKIYDKLTTLDFAIIALYLILLLIIGIVVSRKQNKNETLFLAQNSLNWYNIGFNMWGTNVGPSSLLAFASIGYTAGFANPVTTSVGGKLTFCTNRTFGFTGNPAGGTWTKTGIWTITPVNTPGTTSVSVSTGLVPQTGGNSVRYEVTNAEFQEFVKATNYITIAEQTKDANVFYVGLKDYEWDQDTTAYWRFPNGISRGGIEDKMNHPVTSLCFYDMQAYCKWAGVRLPTLDEWEVACRSSTQTTYFFGDNRDSLKYYGNIWFQNSHLQLDTIEEYFYTSPVGSFKPNSWGLYDTYGNVFEMCSTIPKSFKGSKQLASARGGSWWCSASSCNFFNSVDCGRINKMAVFSNMGFRVVKVMNSK